MRFFNRQSEGKVKNIYEFKFELSIEVTHNTNKEDITLKTMGTLPSNGHLLKSRWHIHSGRLQRCKVLTLTVIILRETKPTHTSTSKGVCTHRREREQTYIRAESLINHVGLDRIYDQAIWCMLYNRLLRNKQWKQTTVVAVSLLSMSFFLFPLFVFISNVDVMGSRPSKALAVSLIRKLYPYCLVLVGSRNGFERDFTIELK